MQNMKIQCSSGDESRLGGIEGLCGMCKEHIKRTSSAYVTDKERSTNNVLCCMCNGCITDKTNIAYLSSVEYKIWFVTS